MDQLDELFKVIAEAAKAKDAEIERLQAEVERLKQAFEECRHIRDTAVLDRDTAHNDAIEAMQAHIKPKSITSWDVKEPDYYYALAHEHMWEDLEGMKR